MMKIKTALAIPLVAVMSAQAEPADLMVEKVTVYVETTRASRIPCCFGLARTLAAEMFASVGVRIDWRAGQRAESH
jgi:hypothetical protein